MALDLDNLTVTGTTYLACRFEAGVITRDNGQINLWDDGGGGPADQSAGSILEGDMTVNLANVTSLRRVGRWNRENQGRFILNSQNDDTGLGGAFTTTVNRATFVMEDSSGAVSSFTVDQRRNGGGNWVDWWRSTGELTDTEWAVLNGVAAGEQCILVIHTGTATYTVPTVVNTGDAETVGFHFEASEATGSASAVTRTGTANPVEYEFTASDARGLLEKRGTANTINFAFVAEEATGSTMAVTVHTGTANTVDFAFTAAEAEGGIGHIRSANQIDYEFTAAQATGDVTAHVGTANAIDFEFAASNPTGVVGSAAAANRVGFHFEASQATGSVTHHVGTADAATFAFEASEAHALVHQIGTAETVRFNFAASEAHRRIIHIADAETVGFHFEASEPTGSTVITTIWGQARDAVIAAIGNVGRVHQVLAAPPKSVAALRTGVTAVVTPPRRTSERRAGCTTKKTYPLQVTVSAPMGTNIEKATLAVDNAVEGIDDEMEQHVTLGGLATSMAPFQWTEATAEEYPPGSGQWHVAMVGTAEIVIVTTVARSA